jgi:uncharacterized LabA/DUF88 family protein
MRTNVYVDGFNLYYCALKGTPCKWLNLRMMVECIFPRNHIHRIRYYTAMVLPPPWDPQKPQRQQMYLRALCTLPELTIHLGQFRSHPRQMPLVNTPTGSPRMVRVLYTEEKGSDVNLATHLLLDGFRGDYEAAIVVSNDSDLAEPIRVVRQELQLPVGILNPQMDGSRVAMGLRKVAAFYRPVTRKALNQSQFPPVLQDANGVFSKPNGW